MTNEEISKLSNHDLTKAILEKLGFYVKEKQYDQDAVVVFGDEFDDGFVDDYLIDYCNNWNDLVPLVLEYEIAFNPINKPASHWEAGGNTFYPVNSKKVTEQRALAECLLLVLLNLKESK